MSLPAAPAGAAGLGAPIFGTRTTTTPIAGESSFFDRGPSRCPSDSVVTGIVALQDNRSETNHWLTGVQLVCSAVDVSGGTAQLGTPTEGPGIIGNQGDYSPIASDCPSGSVVTGFNDGTTGSLVDALQLSCAALNPNGSLGTASQGALVGGPGGSHHGPAPCPAGAVATGAVGIVSDDLDSISFECQSLTFQQPVPTNGAWPSARLLNPNDDVDDTLDTSGEQLWYKVPVQPGSRVQVDLSGLPADYDLAVFKDIGQAFDGLTSTADLTKLSAEFAGDAFSPSVFTPSVFTPSVFTPSVFTPSVFTPSVFTPSVFTPSVFTPSVFTPSALTQSQQDTLSDAFSSAQTRSLLAVSANDGTAPESTSIATWNNTGYFYLRVVGRNGAFSPDTFHLSVRTSGGPCSGLTLANYAGDSTLAGAAGPQTLILTDPDRLAGSSADKTALAAKLTALAAATGGTVVNVSGSQKVRDLNAQADGPAVSCPYAKNLVAQAIRDIVNSYRGSLKYVVLVGGDRVIPFFRYADSAGLGPESNYVPPVLDSSASQASLRTNNVLGQDAYGALTDVSVKGSTLPVPDLAVGRLVETASEISANVDRYLQSGGAAIAPSSSLVTGYDFLTDAADAVAADLRAGVPSNNTTLITDSDVPPSTTTVNGRPDRRHSWTATDLASTLLGSRHDITFLAGHFSANSALAADYSTSLLTTQLASAPAGTFAGTLVFSAGCHSGYNIVDSDGVPGVTVGLDWAQAFAQQGATLLAGTGYQYGDTDFVKYGEKLYSLFAHDLRYGTGPVSIGATLVRAKAEYLAGLTSVTGIDQKTLLESTLFGLPMQGVNLAASGRLPVPTADATQVSPAAIGTDPGFTLGTRLADFDVPLTTTQRTQTLASSAGGTVTATYLTGPDGVVNNPGQPTVPLQSVNVTSPSGQVLRGVGFRSGTYTDTDGVTPLVGVATTEQSGAHTPFTSGTWFPNRIATPNYFGSLSSAGDGTTRLAITPVQYRTDSSGTGTNTQRVYSDAGFQLFYSKNTDSYDDGHGGSNQPALAAPPSITGVTSSLVRNQLRVEARVVGDPSAGIQNVWVTYTGETGSSWHGSWQSLDLTQDPNDSTLWSGVLDLPSGDDPNLVRFMVQAVNGVGLVGVDDNQGYYYAPAVTPSVSRAQQAPTTLVLGSLPSTLTYGTSPMVSATLTSGGNPVVGRGVAFSIGGSSLSGTTDSAGVATATLPVTATPGDYPVTATFAGDAEFAAPQGAAGRTVTVVKAPTTLTIAPGSTPADAAAVTLRTAGVPLREKPVVFLIRDTASNALIGVRTAITGRTGVATLAATDVDPKGMRRVTAVFGSAATPLPGGTTTNLADPVYATSSTSVLQLSTTSHFLTGAIIGKKSYYAALPVAKTASVTATGVPSGLTLARTSSGWAIKGTAPRRAGWYTLAVTSKQGSSPPLTTYYVITIGYGFTKFAAPVNDPSGSVFPASSTVPLRIRLLDANGATVPAATMQDIATDGRATVSVVRVGSTSARANESRVAPVPQTGTSFGYDAGTNQLVYYANAAQWNWVAGRTYAITITVRTEPGRNVGVHTVVVGFATG